LAGQTVWDFLICAGLAPQLETQTCRNNLNLIAHLVGRKNNCRSILPQAQDIVDVIVGLPGPTSDINLLREQQKKFDSAQKFKGDKAYIGEKNVTTPHKKPRKRELSEIQKQENKAFSSSRIIIEHLIRKVKVFQIAAQRFRLRPQTYQQVILTVCGLVRLRIGALVLPA